MNHKVIAFHYTLRNSKNEILDQSEAAHPFTFLAGSAQIIPGLETELLKLAKGEKKKILVAAERAYGLREESLQVTVPLENLPKDVKVGDQFQAEGKADMPPFTVLDIRESEAVLDANHPLAGMDLTFDVELVELRDATDEEVTHGHAHGLEGHSH